MKLKLHIPVEQYGFVEADIDRSELVSVEDNEVTEISEVYRDIKNGFEDRIGLPPKEWREALDTYLITNKLESSQYEAMSIRQKDIIQEIKRSVKRIAYKDNK